MNRTRNEENPERATMTNVEVVQRMYRAFAECDYATFRRLCSPELVWIQNKGFPQGGRHVGPDTVVEKVFKRFGEDWESWRFDIDEYLDVGHSVVVIGSYSGRHRQT